MSSMESTFKVAEIFGPTIQGEGRHVGVPCYFIRFGGCDYRCVWCDSPHAVLPDLVRNLPRMSAPEAMDKILALPSRAKWVVYSGGNPALWDLAFLTAHLVSHGFSVMMETQGTVWKDWIATLDEVCVSPKPPSSQNMTKIGTVVNFLSHFTDDYVTSVYLKVPVFNDTDYEYARDLHEAFPRYELFLSVGNSDPTLPTVGNPTPLYPSHKNETQQLVLDKTTWLMEKVAGDVAMRDVRVFPQMHVLAWGNERGR